MLSLAEHICEFLYGLVDLSVVISLEEVTSTLDPFANVRVPGDKTYSQPTALSAQQVELVVRSLTRTTMYRWARL